jgi:hypothetical protein
VELGFHAWDLDRHGDKELLPYHVKFSIEGIPPHAWFKEITDLILGDEAIIRHVEEDTQKRVDLRAFQCWATYRDPSKIPQSVFLSLSKFEVDPRRAAQAHLNRPREALHSHVFRVLVHIDAIEDLMFYHFPHEDLIADGKRPWTDFCWQYGRADGDLEE